MKRKNIAIISLGIVVLILVLIVILSSNGKTVESGNGWKHLEGRFGKCSCGVGFSGYDVLECEKKATHKIKGSSTYSENYCEEHWESIGKDKFYELAKDNSSDNEEDSKTETQAKICAQKVVEDNLKSPSTAKFCKYSEMNVSSLDDGRWKITGYVDAENSYGAMIREKWVVTLSLTEDGYSDATVVFTELKYK